MSDAITYLIYAILVVVLALAGKYVGEMAGWPIGGMLAGGFIGVGVSIWHNSYENKIM